MNKIDWARKLSSRKFWLALAGLITGLIIYFGGSQEEATSIEGIIMAIASIVTYLFAETAADVSYNENNKDE